MERSRGSTPFKFYEAWFKEGSCLEIIQQAWTSSGSIDSNENISRRFDAIRVALQRWNKKVFSDCNKKLKALESKLLLLQSREVNSRSIVEEEEVEKEISKLWEKQELIWRQRSREIWLTDGDRNSKFFQASTMEKGEVLNNYFKRLFSSSNPYFPEDLQGLISGDITTRENEDLISIPTHEEISEHFAFVPSRWIAESSLLTQELVHNQIEKGLIAKEQSLGRLNGIRIAREAPAISHLMFADDTILFCRANEKEVESLVNCMMIYESWSRQQCSKLKSGVLFSKNCSRALQRILMDKLGIGLVKGEEKHLENPFLFSRSRKKDFNFLKSNLCKRLEGWRMKTLSTIGRMWKGRIDSSRFLATKTWDVLCQPKGCGGLGFRGFNDVNNALLAKLAWFLADNSNRPWAVSLKVKYYPLETFWSVQERSSESPVWRGILEARKLICDGSCTIIANGEDTNLWWQPWIPWMEYDEFRETMEAIRSKAPSLRCVADLMFRSNKTWNHGFLEFLFGYEVGGLISSIQINTHAEKDVIIWKNSDAGAFSVKGAYLNNQRNRFAEKKELWKWLWERKQDSPIAAELEVIKLALLWAKEKNWEDVCIFTDSQVIVNSLLEESFSNWRSKDARSFSKEHLNCQGEGFPWIMNLLSV
ncbi:uncharacterized protein LOC133035933 [Cannabis sativa]|uniref:uncharacterized protein LOC133035933 n=1 Tax=Cannabis sativa TaxID=3483 RepID=UPI0029CA6BF8|nr:uncharacterized protein LOC133035933 [Cannabis sativa]